MATTLAEMCPAGASTEYMINIGNVISTSHFNSLRLAGEKWVTSYKKMPTINDKLI